MSGDDEEEIDTRARLINIIHDWIREDPTLKWHFEVREMGDGFYIGTKCQERRSYTDASVAWIDQTLPSKIFWYHLEGNYHRDQNTWDNASPADPSYFDHLRKMMCEGHNGATFITAKGNKYHSPRKGCISDIK